jgi:hypothetical protein
MEDIRTKARKKALDILDQGSGIAAISREVDREIRKRFPIHPIE